MRPRELRAWAWTLLLLAFGVALEVRLYGGPRTWGNTEWHASFHAPVFLYTPVILAALFGPQVRCSAVAARLLLRAYAERGPTVPVWPFVVLAFLSLVALYLGPFFSFNLFGT